MKAAVVGEHGVEVRDVEKPSPKPNEVLIRIRASSLNRADLLVAQNHQHNGVNVHQIQVIHCGENCRERYRDHG